MRQLLMCALLFSSLLSFAQSPKPPSCVKDEKTIRALLREIVETGERSGLASLEKFYAMTP